MSRPASPVLGPLEGLTADRVNERFLEMMTAAELGPALTDIEFSAIVAELSTGPRLFTFVDLFCGAGGSSIGLTLAGGLLRFAANHAKRNIATHSANFPGAEHACVDLNHYDMRNLPDADVLWASPICTEVSPAGGKKRTKRNPAQLELMKYGPVTADVFERTRATFHDVIRAAEVRRFRYVLVENVVEAVTDWELFGWWLDGMILLGYQWQLVCVSSAHVGGPLNPNAPQRRDRIYVVFNRKDVARPDVDPRPVSRCESCGDVYGFQWWKRAEGTITASGRRFLVGKYGKRTGQYVYRCPNVACRHSVVTPYERPAASVIDWSDLGVRICDRPANDPLSPNTLRRIERGLQMFSQPVVATVAGNTFERPNGLRAWPVGQSPFMARTCTSTDALACPPLLVNSNHDDDRAYPADRAPFPSRTTKIGDGLATLPFLDTPGGSWNRGTFASVEEPFRARTSREFEALCTPHGGAFLVHNYSDGGRPQDRVRPVTDTFGAVTTGRNQGLATPAGAFYVKNYGGNADPGDMVKSVDEPFGTVTTRDHHGVATPPGAFVETQRRNTVPTSVDEPLTTVAAGGNHHGLVVPYYATGVARSTEEPFPTATVKDRFGLAQPDGAVPDVMQAHYRMIQWYEQARAQRFPAIYQMTGNAGEKTAQAGNAVSCNVAQWLGERIAEALNRTAAAV